MIQPLASCEGFGRRSKVRRSRKRSKNKASASRVEAIPDGSPRSAAGVDASNGGHTGKPKAQIERFAQSNRQGFGRSEQLAKMTGAALGRNFRSSTNRLRASASFGRRSATIDAGHSEAHAQAPSRKQFRRPNAGRRKAAVAAMRTRWRKGPKVAVPAEAAGRRASASSAAAAERLRVASSVGLQYAQAGWGAAERSRTKKQPWLPGSDSGCATTNGASRKAANASRAQARNVSASGVIAVKVEAIPPVPSPEGPRLARRARQKRRERSRADCGLTSATPDPLRRKRARRAAGQRSDSQPEAA